MHFSQEHARAVVAEILDKIAARHFLDQVITHGGLSFVFECKVNGIGGDGINSFVNIDLLDLGFGGCLNGVRKSVIPIEDDPVGVDGILIPGHSHYVMRIIDVILATLQGATGCQEGETDYSDNREADVEWTHWGAKL
jgi:hypothetical protein